MSNTLSPSVHLDFLFYLTQVFRCSPCTKSVATLPSNSGPSHTQARMKSIVCDNSCLPPDTFTLIFGQWRLTLLTKKRWWWWRKRRIWWWCCWWWWWWCDHERKHKERLGKRVNTTELIRTIVPLPVISSRSSWSTVGLWPRANCVRLSFSPAWRAHNKTSARWGSNECVCVLDVFSSEHKWVIAPD